MAVGDLEVSRQQYSECLVPAVGLIKGTEGSKQIKGKYVAVLAVVAT